MSQQDGTKSLVDGGTPISAATGKSVIGHALRLSSSVYSSLPLWYFSSLGHLCRQRLDTPLALLVSIAYYRDMMDLLKDEGSSAADRLTDGTSRAAHPLSSGGSMKGGAASRGGGWLEVEGREAR